MIQNFAVVIILSFIAGIVQSISGFASVIVMMLGFPSFFGVTRSAAVAGSISISNNLSMFGKYRKHVEIKKIILPTVLYSLTGFLSVRLTPLINVELIGLMYGVFMILLAVYFFFLESRIKLEGIATMVIAALISGVGTGLFGIGGPLMAVYFSNIFPDRKEYLANSQLMFFIGGFISFITRIASGIYTLDLVKFSVVGIVGIFLGQAVGIRIADHMKPRTLKVAIYVLVLISGIMTVIKYI